ncbi:hypothetical protein GCM10008090_35090 [Arenicella chitinivorans]|uniref:Uncharacterized protein n=1 Tax=Arenicella chitinivorans TaxID=1329800 RepID=A0A918S5T0_9GAMM|nr:hypothetical protein [Arenicella chitinivorans]GHA22260.1 hypothetical protein GCM10008090_35090 [Arenicella chitinivorans]
MKIWRLFQKVDIIGITALSHGAWCSSKTNEFSPDVRVAPLILEWIENGIKDNLVIAELSDIYLCGLGRDLFSKTNVGKKLVDQIEGIGFSKVEFLNSKSSNDLVRSLDLVEESFCELWVSHSCNADLQKSTISSSEGSLILEGVECVDAKYCSRSNEIIYTRKPREKDKGLFVDKEELGANSLFRVREFPNWILCTDMAKEVLTRYKCENINFLEVGETE